MRKSLEGLNSRFEQAGERINELKGRLIEIIESEEQRKKEWRQMNRASGTCGIPHQAYQYVHNGSSRRRGGKGEKEYLKK